MTVASRAETAAKAVLEALQFGATPAQSKQVTRIIEQAMVEAYRDAAERCAHVAVGCCEEDRDLAHKIAEEIRRANTALIANLSSLR